MADHYAAIVIGAGQGGVPLALAWAQAGRKTALIERGDVGGTCVNTGCTPTKTMVASARVAYLARRASDYGVHTGPIHVDISKVRQRKRDIVESFRGGEETKIDQTENLELVRGSATFTGMRQIEVALTNGQSRTLTADQIFINTGASPTPPPIQGLETVPYLDYVSVQELDHVPDHLVILGGGYIALEFGQMFRRFGSAVTIIQRGKQLLDHEDADIAMAVADILRQDGLEILLATNATEVEATRNEAVRVHTTTMDGSQKITGSHLLVATGRKPNTEGLGLESVGIATDAHGFIQVNETLETVAAGVYAIGDVKDGPAFTHISYDDFRILKTNLLENGHRTVMDRPVPYTVFIDPQLGRVGMTEQEARAQGLNIKVATLPMSSVARALETDESRGVMKAIVDADTQQILGCAILGLEGGEIMSVLEVAMMGKLPYTALRDGVFAHPTLSESLNNLFMTLD